MGADTSMARAKKDYVPAAGRDSLLPIYDTLMKVIGADEKRTRLVEQAALQPSYRILDVGCGTGTFAVLLKRMHPGIEVAADDPDPRALSRARQKARTAGVAVEFQEAYGDGLPYPAGSFDRVFSAFMYHHLSSEDKGNVLSEIRRVLKPGGRLELLDFAGPVSDGNILTRIVHSHSSFRENAEDRVLAMLAAAGFTHASVTGHDSLLMWRLAYYEAH